MPIANQHATVQPSYGQGQAGDGRLAKPYAGDAALAAGTGLFREKGSTLHMLGCLPMFLQTRLDRLVCRFVFGRGDAARTRVLWDVPIDDGSLGILVDLSDQDHMLPHSANLQVLLFRLVGSMGFP